MVTHNWKNQYTTFSSKGIRTTSSCRNAIILNSMSTTNSKCDAQNVVQDQETQSTEAQSSHSVTIVSEPISKSQSDADVNSSSLAKTDIAADSIKRKPSNFLVPSVLVSLLCFWPLGFAAIWQAMKSQRAAKIGEYGRAKTHSKMAKSFIAFSVALGVLQAIAMVTVVMLQLYVFPHYSYSPVKAIATRMHQ